MQILSILQYIDINMQNMQNYMQNMQNMPTLFQYAEYALPTLLMITYSLVQNLNQNMHIYQLEVEETQNNTQAKYIIVYTSI